jgi:hypothetical protein
VPGPQEVRDVDHGLLGQRREHARLDAEGGAALDLERDTPSLPSFFHGVGSGASSKSFW